MFSLKPSDAENELQSKDACPCLPNHLPLLGSFHTALQPHPPFNFFNSGAQSYCVACLQLSLKHAPPDGGLSSTPFSSVQILPL